MIIEKSRVAWAAGCSVETDVALLLTMEGIVTEPKTPLNERALDGLMLATDTAVVSYQEERLRLQVARKVRDGQRAGLAHTQTGKDDEIA